MSFNTIPNATRWLSLVGLIALLLSACTPAVTAVPQATSAPQVAPTSTTAAPIATLAPQPTATAAPTATIAASPTTQAVSSGAITYKIVPGESKVTYEVGETFINQNNRFNLAKGITNQVTGEVYGDTKNPGKASIGVVQIDISQFQSDNSRRDGYIRSNGLESSKYPIAKFVATKIDSLPSSYTEGQSYTLKVTGDLTIKTITKSVTWNVTTKLNGSNLTGTATTEILMSDYKVGPISILGVLNTEDKVKLTFEFVAKP